jgi:hypothetical protein
MTTANIVVRKILPGRGNTAVSTNYTGIVGEVTVDTGLDTLRVHDGVTPGGTRLATYDELANVSLGNINLSGYATTAQITAANANAAVQAIAINSINANIGAFQTYANATFTGGGTDTGNITFTDDEIGSTSNVVNINASEYAQLQSGNVYIWAEQGEGAYVQSGDSYTWQFGTDGALILPNGSTIGDGDAVFGVPITTSRGTILLGNQAECAGGESHFHIMPGGQQAIDLFLGDDSNYVKLPNTGGVEIASASNAQNIWTFGTDGNLTLPAGSILSETANTTVISPPGASTGQSLVIRPTAVSALSASGYIVPGQNLTITLTNQSNGTLDATGVTYEITGATAQQLGIGSLTGTFPAFSPAGEVPQTTTVVLPIPEYTSAATLTLTVGGDNPWNTTFITVTDNGVIETSHIHLVAGDPVTTDIYLGDDDQYVKIEKDGGDVVIGTDTNTKHWTFDTSGILTFPSGMTMGNTGAGDVIETTANSFIGILAQGSVGGVGVQWVNDYSNPTSVAGMILNSPFAANNTGAVQLITGAIDPSGPTSIEHTWTFGANGSITFPDNTVQTTAYRKIAQENLMLDGGAAAAIYEVTVDYAEGGFSSTRYGVNTPSFNGGGAEITEPTYYTLNGGGA